ncbi:uncharacterized protein LOC134204562 isoform X2 [Armigeres subalbatus]|uniref:uncharacterized protein LOC134204562 isoform X2 n=1 Tax=Armigeres subalbatus TaxID=124917 RepID=UPI002ED38DF8
MAPVTRRSSIELERSRKAKMLFLKKRLAGGVGYETTRKSETETVPLVGSQNVKQCRKREIPKASTNDERSSGLKRSGPSLTSEPVQSKHLKSENVQSRMRKQAVVPLKLKKNVGDVKLRKRTDRISPPTIQGAVVTKITEVDKPPQFMFAPITSAESGEPNVAQKRSGPSKEHPSCSSLNVNGREENEASPFVFAKIEEQSMIRDMNRTVKAEERPILDETNGSTAISSGDQKTKDNKEDAPSVEINWKFLEAITFANVKSFVETLESGFRFKTQNSSSKGVIRYYNCRRIKVNAKVQCNRKVMVFIPNTANDECSVHIKGQHNCNDMGSESKAKMALQPNDHSTINEMLRTGMPKKDQEPSDGPK